MSRLRSTEVYDAGMSEQLIIVAEIVAKPGKSEELKRKLLAMLGPSRAEPGCVSYTLHEDPKKPEELLFYEVWKDQAAFDYHCATPHFQQLGPSIEPLVGRPVNLRHLRIVG